MKLVVGNSVNKASVAHLLRGWVGHGRMPVEVVSSATGIPARTIYDHMDTLSATLPNAAHVAAYMALFGPLFTNLFLSMIGQGGAVETHPTLVHAHEELSRFAAFAAFLAHVLDDARIDHREMPGLIRRADAHAVEALSFVAALKSGMIKEAA